MHTYYFNKETSLKTKLTLCRVHFEGELSYGLLDEDNCVIGLVERDVPKLFGKDFDLALRSRSRLKQSAKYHAFPVSSLQKGAYPTVTLDTADDYVLCPLEQQMKDVQAQAEALYEEISGKKYVHQDMSQEELQKQAVLLYEQTSGKKWDENQQVSMEDIEDQLEDLINQLDGDKNVIECVDFEEVHSANNGITDRTK